MSEYITVRREWIRIEWNIQENREANKAEYKAEEKRE